MKIALPEAFVVTTVEKVLAYNEVLLDVSEGILQLVNSGHSMDVTAYTATPLKHSD